ncbi:MAG: flagellar type III secretion system pore protein FliP [Phycisphaeraceae bacterium]|nr:flagellar type III secretion system pore protein FliP [Phycisphaeraceae bacterium]
MISGSLILAIDATPIALLEEASRMLPGSEGGPSGLSTSLNIVLLLTVLSLAPAILILCTCFTRMVVVLGLLRQALGLQSLPPSQTMVGLSLLLTFVVMAPTAARAWDEGLGPYMRGEITDQRDAWTRAAQPLRDFMFAQIDATGNWDSLVMMLRARGVDTSDLSKLTRADVDMLALVPAFVISELKTAFLIGFRIYLPFLVIDLVISGLLVSMGMMMLPPILVSLPIKLLLFVMADGWTLVVGSLLSGFASPLPESVVNLLTPASPDPSIWMPALEAVRFLA